MKVLVRFDRKVYVVENVGVDHKCLPIVAGRPPYSETSSPFVLESVLWFKTMALEAVYIDCHQRLVYWTPLAITQEVQTQIPQELISDKNNFVPSTAKPLFMDNSVYDFDASPKEMMIKCCQVSRKLSTKSISTDEFHKSIARILHVYILPSIMFTRDDIFSLSQAKSQIENHLNKAEADIKNCAIVTENLKNCLNRMVSELLNKENMDSENYLRNCKKNFLVAFLKVVTSDIDNLNTELSATQNNVNWAREHSQGDKQLADLKEKRDHLFLEIDKRIMAREAIKNVIMRRKLTKRKAKKGVVINSCVHNVFVEILRKLEAENLILRQMGQDKVSICAAREAVLSTLAEVTCSSHNSDHPSKFDLENFVDCLLVDRKGISKPEDWLTLEDRVAKLLQDNLSVPCAYHESGCKKLISEIHHILNELRVAPISRRVDSFTDLQKSCQVDNSRHLSLNDVTLREQRFTEKTPHKGNDIGCGASECRYLNSQQSVTNSQQIQALEVAAEKYTAENKIGCATYQRGLPRSRSAVALQGSQCEVSDGGFSENFYRRTPVISRDDLAEHLAATDELVQSGDSGICREDESSQKGLYHAPSQQVRVNKLLSSIDKLKGLMQVHFTEVIECLDQDLEREENWDTSFQEQKELLWRSYEHFFCQELYLPLMQLYKEGLTPCVQQAYAALCVIPIQEILKEDKLLDLFFEQHIASSRTAPITIACPRKPNGQCFTYHGLVAQPCYITDLYFPANADGNHHHHESYLDSTITYEDGATALSYDSVLSITPSIDEEFGTMASCCYSVLSTTPSIDEGFDSISCSFSSSFKSDFSVGSLDDDIVGDFYKMKTQSNPKMVDEMLETVLTQFRMHVNKCLDSDCFLDKIRHITKAIELLNKDISQMIGPDYQSACDDIISMLVLALYHVSEDMFVDLYVNLCLLMDVLPSFLNGSLWDYNLVSLCASYNYLFTMRKCEHVVKRYPGLVR